ncbi:kinase [Oceanobacillus sp. 1P07AA]|uniref:kinase n=1 Tax=Oceanobacillus sp. 1P07AA TaxID=3132293 RepID=UPI0039A78331
MDNIIHTLIQEQYKTQNVERPFIVGIDGLSGTGKTTIVQKLKQNNPKYIVIHIDEYIVTSKNRYDTGYEEWYEYYQLQWDVQCIKKCLFEELHQNRTSLTLPYNNREKDSIDKQQILLPRNCIVIIEGVFLLREEWKAYYDYTIFLDCPRNTRYQRALNRDTYIGSYADRMAKYKRRYWLAEDYYMNLQQPKSTANKVLDLH